MKCYDKMGPKKLSVLNSIFLLRVLVPLRKLKKKFSTNLDKYFQNPDNKSTPEIRTKEIPWC